MRPIATPLAGAALTFAALIALPGQARAMEDGFYFGLGLGGALVSGERGVAFDDPCSTSQAPSSTLLWTNGSGRCTYMGAVPGYTAQEAREELIRTDFGSGLGFQMRLGYNILGYASVEAALAGHGDFSEGAGHVGGQIRVHPAQFFIPFQDRDWDTDLSVGFGYSIGGYQPAADVQRPIVGADDEDDGKGWEGTHLSFGAGFNYMVASRISLGLDLRLVLPAYETWIANWDDGLEGQAAETPGTTVFMPLLQVTFHL